MQWTLHDRRGNFHNTYAIFLLSFYVTAAYFAQKFIPAHNCTPPVQTTIQCRVKTPEHKHSFFKKIVGDVSIRMPVRLMRLDESWRRNRGDETLSCKTASIGTRLAMYRSSSHILLTTHPTLGPNERRKTTHWVVFRIVGLAMAMLATPFQPSKQVHVQW